MAENNIRSLIGKKMTKSVKFLNTDVQISKLSVQEVINIQEKAKNISEDPENGFNLLVHVIRASVDGASEITDEEFKQFPMDELSRLSNEVMKFSGITGDQGK